jgi:hypothetical protein
VTGSLETSKAKGRISDLVLVETSRTLSPERKSNIEKRTITEFGMYPLSLEDQPNIAELIYRNSRWRF